VGISRAKKNVALFYLDQFPLWIKLTDPQVFEGELYRDIQALSKDVLMQLELYISLVNIWVEGGFSIEYAKKQLDDNESELIEETILGLIEVGISENDARLMVNEMLSRIGKKS
jgi:hypothetical protein